MARGNTSKTYPSSISVRAFRKRPKAATIAKGRAADSPHLHARRPLARAPIISTAKYLTLIFAPHRRHLPLRKHHEKRGIRSLHSSIAPQSGQADRSLPPHGLPDTLLRATTLRNEPREAPNIANSITIKAFAMQNQPPEKR